MPTPRQPRPSLPASPHASHVRTRHTATGLSVSLDGPTAQVETLLDLIDQVPGVRYVVSPSPRVSRDNPDASRCRFVLELTTPPATP